MKRRKGISAVALMLALSMGSAGAAVALGDPGGGRGDGAGGNGGQSAPSDPGGGGSQGGDAGTSRGGDSGGTGGGGGNPSGGQGGRDGGSSTAPGSGSVASSSVGSGTGPGGSGHASSSAASQTSSANGSSSRNPQSGRGNGHGNGSGNSDNGSGRCSTACHISQQPPTGTAAFTPLPVQSTTPSVSPAPVSTTPAPQPTTTSPAPKPVIPARSYSSSSSDRGSSGRRPTVVPAAIPGGIVPAVGASATPGPSTGGLAGARAALNSLIGAVPISTSSTHANRFRHASGKGTSTASTTPPPSSPSSVIERIERVIPTGIWIALAAALAFAAAAGIWALWSGRRARRQAGEFAAMSAAALTDPLTGILNRRGFTEAFERELARARRYNRPFVLAYVDVRGLKAVNDSQGHRAGDELLREAAQLLQASARADDVAGRLGGDEMGLLLVEQSTEGAEAVQRRIHAHVAARREAMALQTPWDLTIGTAAYPEDGESFDELLQAADRRLYEQRGIELLEDPAAAWDDRR